VARQDAELARLAGQRDEFRLAGEDLLLGADDVDMDRVGLSVAPERFAGQVGQLATPSSGRRGSGFAGPLAAPTGTLRVLFVALGGGAEGASGGHWIFLAFSNASSIVPTM
jgi:hypothetical protein